MQVMVIEDEGLECILKGTDDIFREELGQLKGYAHRILLKKDCIPVQHKVRRVPIVVREEVKNLIKEMLVAGVIEPVEASPWISPVVITKKAGGKLRFCVDLRSLNQCVVADTFPLPNITELVTTLKGSKVFSKLDLKSA